MYRKAGLLLTLSLLAACGPRGTYITAVVERVERSCEYTETAKTRDRDTGATTRSSTKRNLDCSSDPAFLKIKRGDRSKRLYGHATAIVRYTSPQDQKPHQAWVKIDSKDRHFYSLDAGQQVQVRVDPEDPSVASL